MPQTSTPQAMPPRARRVMARAALFAMVLVLASACGQRETKPEEPQPRLDNGTVVFPEGSRQAGFFVTGEVKMGSSPKLQLAGRVVWNEERTVRLYPPFGGRVTRILAKPGDAVRAGQALAVLASPDFGQTQTEARRAQADFALADKNLKRVRELQAAGVLPAKDVQSAEADFSRAESELKRATARVSLYGKSDTVDQTLTLASPIAGVLVERNINPGQKLRPDLQLSNLPALFVITDPARLWVQLDASERDLRLLKKGQPLKLRAPAWPDDTFAASIDAVADFIDPATRTIKVRGSVDNRGRKLKGDMYVTAEVDSGAAPALEVPSKAAFLLGDKYYVFAEEGPRRYRRVEVMVGAESQGRIAVVSGLKAGQKVVVEGVLFLNRIQRSLESGAPA